VFCTSQDWQTVSSSAQFIARVSGSSLHLCVLQPRASASLLQLCVGRVCVVVLRHGNVVCQWRVSPESWSCVMQKVNDCVRCGMFVRLLQNPAMKLTIPPPSRSLSVVWSMAWLPPCCCVLAAICLMSFLPSPRCDSGRAGNERNYFQNGTTARFGAERRRDRCIAGKNPICM